MNTAAALAESHVIILGAGIMQVPALQRARLRCAEVTAVDGNPDAPGRSISSHFVHADISNPSAVLAALRTAARVRPYAGILTVGTDYSTSVASVAVALGLPGLSPEAATLARDKLKMREALANAGVPSPPFIAADVHALPDPDFPLPWVVKPRRSMGARGVRSVSDRSDLAEAVAAAAVFDPEGACIVEGFVEGPEFSVDALVHDGHATICGIADRHIGLAPAFVELGHTLPSSFDALVQDQLVSVLTQGIRALGIDHGAAKGDVFLGPQGPVIGEIAARLSGGFMSGWTYPAASGVQSIDRALAEAIGMDHRELAPVGNGVSGAGAAAERGILGLPGRLRRVIGLEGIADLPGHVLTHRSVADGELTHFPRSNVEKLGNLIFCGNDAAQADERVEAALSRIVPVYRTDAPESEQTREFLLGSDARQDAFPKLRTVLREVYPQADIRSMGRRQSTSGIREDRLPLGDVETMQSVSGVDHFHRRVRDVVAHLGNWGLIKPSRDPGPIDAWFWHALMRGGLSGALFALECSGISIPPDAATVASYPGTVAE